MTHGRKCLWKKYSPHLVPYHTATIVLVPPPADRVVSFATCELQRLQAPPPRAPTAMGSSAVSSDRLEGRRCPRCPIAGTGAPLAAGCVGVGTGRHRCRGVRGVAGHGQEHCQAHLAWEGSPRGEAGAEEWEGLLAADFTVRRATACGRGASAASLP